jgi:polyisoprenoid-binding protein YceI
MSVSFVRRIALGMMLATCGAVAQATDSYKVDLVHSSISFSISHASISNIHGRFNQFSGDVTIDADPAKSSFALTIPIDSIDTNNVKRDEHLRAPDYFNAKQYPALTFKSTKVKAVDGGYEVTGDLTMHGVTKPLTIKFNGGHNVVEFPKGTKRIGLTADFVVKRSEFGMEVDPKALGDEVLVFVGIEASK